MQNKLESNIGHVYRPYDFYRRDMVLLMFIENLKLVLDQYKQ